MRNKIKITSIVLATAIMLPVFVFAEDLIMDPPALPLPTKQTVRIELKNKAVELQKELRNAKQEEARLAAQQALEKNKRELREDVTKSMRDLITAQITRLDNAFVKLQNLIDRIEIRSSILEGSEADKAKLEGLIEKAKGQKQEADAMLAELKDDYALLQTPATDTEVAQVKQSVRTFMASVNSLKRKMIDLHKTLMDTVRLMKQMEAKNRAANPDPTPEPASSSETSE